MAFHLQVTPILSGRTLNIRDLNEVIALLERHHYSKASYHQLGLCLKVSHNTLESITKDYRDVLPCFRECLVSWLRKADGVETPTMDTLIAALRGIGENAVADGIDEEKQIYNNLPRSEIMSQDRLTTTPTLEVNEDHPNQPTIL
uniref:Death domain-containing protein n=1 Tax=Amphimedon queenslandica TaxID=400682 RepID=A0A1X7SXS1_AMPQE